jgi:hypothetical protein
VYSLESDEQWGGDRNMNVLLWGSYGKFSAPPFAFISSEETRSFRSKFNGAGHHHRRLLCLLNIIIANDPRSAMSLFE